MPHCASLAAARARAKRHGHIGGGIIGGDGTETGNKDGDGTETGKGRGTHNGGGKGRRRGKGRRPDGRSKQPWHAVACRGSR